MDVVSWGEGLDFDVDAEVGSIQSLDGRDRLDGYSGYHVRKLIARLAEQFSVKSWLAGHSLYIHAVYRSASRQ